eukprot:COSAG01_NODE_99_length_26583_cov_79.512536_2_plen_176_part_00
MQPPGGGRPPSDARQQFGTTPGTAVAGGGGSGAEGAPPPPPPAVVHSPLRAQLKSSAASSGSPHTARRRAAGRRGGGGGGAGGELGVALVEMSLGDGHAFLDPTDMATGLPLLAEGVETVNGGRLGSLAEAGAIRNHISLATEGGEGGGGGVRASVAVNLSTGSRFIDASAPIPF